MLGNHSTDPRLILRALGSRNYRLFYIGQGVSLVGTWMQRIAVSWLVYRLTNSAFLLGIVGFAGQLPSFIFAPFAGVWVDRINKRRLLMVTQVAGLIQASLLAGLVLANRITVWEVLALSLILGLVNAVDVPARQAFVVEMLERREDLGNAIALNSSLVNIARILGPSLAGILIAAFGEGVCFVVNALSFLAAIAALVAMRITIAAAAAKHSDVWSELKEGLSYAFGFAPIRSLLLLMALISLMGMPYQILMPVIARDVLHGNSRLLGFLMGSAGAGALCGALWLASRSSLRGLGVIIPAASFTFGLGLMLFSRSHWTVISMALLFLTGMGMIVQMAATNTTLQSVVEDDKRGRVMSLYTMAFLGMSPFGSLLAGGLASRIGAPNTILFGGACCVIAAILFRTHLKGFRELMQPALNARGYGNGDNRMGEW